MAAGCEFPDVANAADHGSTTAPRRCSCAHLRLLPGECCDRVFMVRGGGGTPSRIGTAHHEGRRHWPANRLLSKRLGPVVPATAVTAVTQAACLDTLE